MIVSVKLKERKKNYIHVFLRKTVYVLSAIGCKVEGEVIPLKNL